MAESAVTVREHTERVRATAEAFNKAIAAAQADGVRVRYSKGELEQGGWNGPLTITEIANVTFTAPRPERSGRG